jgi:hypothetical protein
VAVFLSGETFSDIKLRCDMIIPDESGFARSFLFPARNSHINRSYIQPQEIHYWRRSSRAFAHMVILFWQSCSAAIVVSRGVAALTLFQQVQGEQVCK